MNICRHLLIIGIVFIEALSQNTWAVSGTEAEKWTEDLDILSTKFVEREKTFDAKRKAQFLDSIESIRADLNTLDEDHIVTRIMQAVAIARNAHTTLLIADFGPIRARLPIRLYCFEDGFYIVKARPAHDELLRKRIVGIGGHPIDEVLESVTSTFYGNKSWKRYNSLYPLITPSFLYGLDLIDTPGSVTITVEDENGKRSEHSLKPDPLPEDRVDEQPWWHMTPTYESADKNWKHALNVSKRKAPLYLKNPNECFWYTFLPEQKALYVQYNISRKTGVRNSRFIKEINKSVTEKGFTNLIIDLRMNTGGNYYLALGLLNKLMKIESFKAPGSIQVITGAATFSAGIFHATNIKTQGGIVAGELVGDDLDFWAEGGSITLPNSKLIVLTNNGFHSYSKVKYPELEKFVHTDMDIDTLEPQIPAALTFDDYINNHDPVLEAIFKNR